MPERLEADRHELARHFVGARATYLKLQGAPAIVRDDVLDAAFNAAADIGCYNRKYRQNPITIEEQL